MTTTETVTSAAILREVRARVLTLVTNPPKYDDNAGAWKAWKTQVEGLGQLEVIYSRPEIIPLGTSPEQYPSSFRSCRDGEGEPCLGRVSGSSVRSAG